jgi:hypothetical protein
MEASAALQYRVKQDRIRTVPCTLDTEVYSTIQQQGKPKITTASLGSLFQSPATPIQTFLVHPRYDLYGDARPLTIAGPSLATNTLAEKHGWKTTSLNYLIGPGSPFY